MPASPNVLFGTVVDTDGSTILVGVDVFVFNKTKNESHGFFDSGFEDLRTNSEGEWQVNLGSFTDGWDENDIVYVSARNGEDTAQRRLLVSSSGSEINLTMETVEPIINLLKFLWSRVPDRNTTRNNISTTIFPNYPRGQVLSKSSYPRINVEWNEGETEEAGLTSSGKEIVSVTVIVGINVWDKENNMDGQIFTHDSVVYSGNKLRDLIARDVADVLRQRMLLRPAFKRDPLILPFYDYQRKKTESQDFDEDEGINTSEIEFNLTYYRQT